MSKVTKIIDQRDISYRLVQIMWMMSDISSVANTESEVRIEYKNGDVTTIVKDPNPNFKYTDKQVGKDF